MKRTTLKTYLAASLSAMTLSLAPAFATAGMGYGAAADKTAASRADIVDTALAPASSTQIFH